MSNTAMWRILLAGLLVVLGIGVVQTYWMINSFSRVEKTFEEKVYIALRNVAEQISELRQVQLPSQKLITKVTQDYYVVNIKDVIDAADLEYYLRTEFEQVNLQSDFEYGIYDCSDDVMVYGNYIGFTDRTKAKPATQLERYDEYVYYFGVRFPNRKGYVLNSLWLPIVFTVILIAAICFFLFAISEILKQRKLSDLQKDFINNMTHEFKTPLSSIKVSSEVLMKDARIQQDERLTTYAGIIQSQAKRLSDHVERVLQIAGVRKGELELTKKKIDLHELLHNITEQIRKSTAKSQAQIRLQLDSDTIFVFADQHHLTNVVHNLVDNAIKYSDDHPEILVGATQCNGTVKLFVSDKGIGIPQEQLSKITEKFYRVSTGNIHNVKGFGLGLHYVKNVADAHRWNMDIVSAVGEGTTVTLEIEA